jgi:hypothetical protein
MPVLFAASLLTIASDASGASRWARAANTVPVISGAPASSVSAGEDYLFTPAVADDDGPRLQFRVRGKPAWASFDTSTGSLGGRPTRGDVGTYQNISISVDDGIAGAVMPAFSITVLAPAGSIAEFRTHDHRHAGLSRSHRAAVRVRCRCTRR